MPGLPGEDHNTPDHVTCPSAASTGGCPARGESAGVGGWSVSDECFLSVLEGSQEIVLAVWRFTVLQMMYKNLSRTSQRTLLREDS